MVATTPDHRPADDTAPSPAPAGDHDGVAADARQRSLLLRALPARRLGLRARVTLVFALGALLLSALLAGITFAVVRTNLLAQRESTALNQAYTNAGFVRNRLPADATTLNGILASLRTTGGSNPIIFANGEFTALDPANFGEDSLPPALRAAVLELGPSRMRFRRDGQPLYAVGIPLRSVDAAYFEVVELDDTADTLRTLGLALLGAAAATTAAGAALGWWASRRALRPLADVSQAAEAIARGRLDTRLEGTTDPDLGSLSTSFNDMASALQARIERDGRFASDVSHELRSPLMTMAAAADVLANQRDGLPERARQAVDLVTLEVGRFNGMVEDLLEISRYDAGVVRLQLDEVHLAEFLSQAIGAAGYPQVPIELDAELADAIVVADKRRLARVIANLLDNARKYGDGATAVQLIRGEGTVEIAVEDAGPGVPVEDRDVIFDRFARGGVAGRRGAGEGVGLGLALVAEHVRLHNGHIRVEDRPDGRPGARFVVVLRSGAP